MSGDEPGLQTFLALTHLSRALAQQTPSKYLTREETQREVRAVIRNLYRFLKVDELEVETLEDPRAATLCQEIRPILRRAARTLSPRELPALRLQIIGDSEAIICMDADNFYALIGAKARAGSVW